MMEEESFMLRHKIPMYEHHVKDHSKFLNLLKRIKWGLDDKTLVIDAHLADMLKETALYHIQYEDVQYGEYYRNHVVDRKMPS
jgi:hemerythrin